MKERIIKDIICAMSGELSTEQLRKLESVVRIKLHGVNLQEESTAISTYQDDNDYILKVFVANKKLENASDKSIVQYVSTTRKLFDTINKNYKDITTDDIKFYLATYQSRNHVAPNTLANMKRFLSTFFGWCEDGEYIPKNPVRAIKNIKQVRKEKKFLTNDEVERMRDKCETLRETALLEFLLSTGLRVSELTSMVKSDVNFSTDEVRIYGSKTRTYRTGYLTPKAKLHLRKYLLSRNDDNKALFVTSRKPNLALGNKSVQTELQNIAARAEIEQHVAVHLLRKTLATMLREKGSPIEVIKEILGHADISVTEKNYVTVNPADIKSAHRKIA